jgi:putative ABC transport system ATP-binding protein
VRSITVPTGEAISACSGVSVVYSANGREVRALDHVSLEITAGERVALLGRSGSGKTTLLHVLGGLIEPTSGIVYWQGHPLTLLDHAVPGGVRAHGIAYVFQGANLLPHFNAFENVAFATSLAGKSRFTPAELLELVGLPAKADLLPGELSGGEAQRVALARAIAERPTLLLCDEPTGHLDSDTAFRTLDLIDALQAELGFTLVIATHDASVAARLDWEVELEDGVVCRDERL